MGEDSVQQSSVIPDSLDKQLADAIMEVLVDKAKGKSINAAEIGRAIELLERRGYKFIEPNSKALNGGRKLPELPAIEDEEVITLDNGIQIRQPK